VVAGGSESDGAEAGGPDRHSGSDADGGMAASYPNKGVFPWRPEFSRPRFGSHGCGEHEWGACCEPSQPGSDADSGAGDTASACWVVDQARHLIDTFGWRAIAAWQECISSGSDGPRCTKRGGDCICRHVWEGIDWYDEHASDIADCLLGCRSLAIDEAHESDA